MSEGVLNPIPARPVSARPEKRYDRTVMAKASGRFWRATAIFLVTVLINAVVQSVLVWPALIPNFGKPVFLLLALISFAGLLFSSLVLAIAALETAAGKVVVSDTFNTAWRHFPKYVLWIVPWVVIALLLLVFNKYAGFCFLAITIFLPVAAADSHPNPVKANFLAIKSRPVRFVFALIMTVLLLGLMQLGASLVTFLLNPAIAAFLVWLYVGVATAWLLTAWGLIYRSTTVGAVPADPTVAETLGQEVAAGA